MKKYHDIFSAIAHRLLIISFALSLCPALLYAAEEPEPGSKTNLHQWGAVTLFHGLPSNHVRAIAQDSEGVMWFGTDSGIAKYDGRRIQKIVPDNLPAGRIRALKFDGDNLLWIGTDKGGAVLSDGEFAPIPGTENRAITAILDRGERRAVMASEQGEIFDIGLLGKGKFVSRAITPTDCPLLRLDASGRVPLPLTSISAFGNTLIIGTRGRGLLRAQIEEAGAPVVEEITSRPRAFFVEAVETSADHHLWLGSQTTSDDSGLYANGESFHPAKIGAGLGSVTALAFDAGNELWVGTDGQGVFRYKESRRLDHFTFEGTAGGLRSNRIYSICIDREGVAWFGTDRGICRYDPHALRSEKISDDPESNFARVLFQSSDGSLWCGTNRGLFERGSAGWQQIESLRGKTIYSIAEHPRGRLLVGTAGGLFAGPSQINNHAEKDSRNRLNTERAFVRIEAGAAPSDNIRAIRTFRGAIYLANFGYGIERLEGSKRTHVWPPESADARERQVTSLYGEKDERLWIGTAEAGAMIFDGQEVSADAGLSKLKGATVWGFCRLSNGALWIASARGLYLLRSGELAQVVEGNEVRSIVIAPDSQNSVLCATSGGGALKVLLDDESEPIAAKVDVEQGLPSQNVFTILAEASNAGVAIWMGTNRGIARYEPGKTAPLLFPTRVMGKRIFTREEIRSGFGLEYPQDSLALDVAATSSRTFPEQFQYSFSVLDSEGRLVRHKLSRDSQLLLENLQAGRYLVKARAFTNDLIVSAPLSFEFTVARAPFPWTSTALSILLALALLAMFWGFHQNRKLASANNALEGTNRQLAATRMALASETEAERRRISRDLHDQTLADLRRLLMLTDQLPSTNEPSAIQPSGFRSRIESISTEIRRICEDLSPSALANVGLAAALEWALSDGVAQLPDERKFEYEFRCDEGMEDKLQLAPAAQIQIYRIMQEAVSNICRHSNASRVSMEVATEADGGLFIRLEDNGRGFDAGGKKANKGRGLTNIRSRASLIDAEVKWENSPKSGMIFTLRKPPGRPLI